MRGQTNSEPRAIGDRSMAQWGPVCSNPHAGFPFSHSPHLAPNGCWSKQSRSNPSAGLHDHTSMTLQNCAGNYIHSRQTEPDRYAKAGSASVRLKLAQAQRETRPLSSPKSYQGGTCTNSPEWFVRSQAPQKSSFIPRGMPQMVGLSPCWCQYLSKAWVFTML